ncbi:MAG: type II toxin-antitoxin system HicB family antitoxin [Blastocatellia bacterium]
MNCDILVTPTENGFAATVLGLPDCAIEAPTRDEAIEKAKAEAEELITKSEIVRVEINGKIEPKSFAGMWANDQTFDDFLAAMKAYRAQLDAEEKEEAKNRCIGIFSDLDDETWNQFQTAMKEYRQQVDADPNRF